MQDILIYANIHKTKKNDETSEDHQAPSSAQNTSLEFSIHTVFKYLAWYSWSMLQKMLGK